MKVVEQFKRRILDLAIRGKLVPQDPNDEPASVLLERIKAEKAKLVKAGKIKKEKNPSEIVIGSDGAAYEKLGGDAPFELPQGWVWCKLGDIGSWKAGATPSRKEQRYYTGGNIPWLKTGDLNDGVIDTIPESITPDAVAETSVRLNPIGSVLIAMYGATIGKLGLLGIAATTNQACCACIVADGIYNKYLFYFLMAQRDHFKALGGGGAQPNISKDIIVSYPFPLPPILEQRSIVANLEELFKIADSLGAAVDGLENTAKRLGKKILDLAIRGKLVPQDPNDEPAHELVKRIAASHKSPSKNQSEPIDPPFNIPDSWEWVRLKDLGVFCGGHTPSTSNPNLWGGDMLWVSSKDMKSKYIDDTQMKVTQLGAEELNVLKPGTLLMCTRSGILRRVFPIAIARRELTINQDQRALTLWLPEMIEYVYLALKSLESIILSDYKKSGTTVESIIWNKFVDLPIPLPPLNEQKRIVKRVDELKALTRMFATS